MSKVSCKTLLGGVVFGISVVSGLATAGNIQVQCAVQGTQIGATDTLTGNIATVPFKVLFSPESTTNTSISSSSFYVNSITLTSNTLSGSGCGVGYLNMYLTGLSPNSASVVVNVSGADNVSQTVPVANGLASITLLNVSNLANAAASGSSGSDVVSVSVFNQQNTIALPENIKITIQDASLRNAATVYSNAPFMNISNDFSMVYIPNAYIPSSNSVQAAYVTMVLPSGISASNVNVYVGGSNTAGYVNCGTASQMAIPGSNALNKYVLDLSKLPGLCANAGLTLSSSDYQSGVPLVFTVSGASGSLNVSADGYSIFGVGSSYYIKPLNIKIINSNASN